MSLPSRTPSTAAAGRSRPLRALLLLAALLTAAPAADLPSAPPLTTAAAVRTLSAADAAAARPVRLEGVVLTVVDWPAFVLWDGTDGVYVTAAAALVEELQPGTAVALQGVTGPGHFAPMVRATAVQRTGQQPLPEPVRTSVTEVAGGGFDAKWVEVEGIVRSCVQGRASPAGFDDAPPAAPGRGPARENTYLTIASGDVLLRLRVGALLDAAALVDARVRVRGVCFNVHNANRQFVRASLRIPRPGDITVLVPPPPDPFALPLRRAGELLQFDPAGFSGHRVRIRGVVTRRQPGDALWIRDGGRGLRIVSAQADAIAPGDEVEVAGFVEKGRYSPALVDAVFRRVAHGTPPEPIAIGGVADAVAHESDLVRLEAELRDVRSGPEGQLLLLDWSGTALEALLPRTNAAPGDVPWEPGSRLQLTGICAVAPGTSVPENGLWQVERFQLLLRDVADVSVRQAAPWLNPRRLAVLLGAGAAVLVGALVLVWSQSRRQAAQREIERRMAEAEFAAILGERNRVARDIHDTLAQGLNAVSMQLELAKNMAGRGAPAMLPHVATAHAVVRSCLAEARESIWNMRSHALEKSDLAGALGNVLRQMTEGLPLEARIEVAGPSRRLAPQLENALLRIGQEGISNALKHAAASRLELQLEFQPGRVRLRITDDGRGFDPAANAGEASRFGLKGIRERVREMGATLQVDSAPGRGTTLLIESILPDDGNPAPASA